MRRGREFLLGCIPMRVLFAYMAYRAKPPHLHWLAVIALLPAVGFCVFVYD